MTNGGVNGFPSNAPVDSRYLAKGAAFPFGYLRSGAYYFTASANAASTSAALGVGTLRVVPWLVPNSCTLSAIGASVSTTGDSGSKLRIGVYADGGTGFPGQLVLDAGTIAGDSNTVQEIAINLSLAAGLYWVGGAVQVVTTTQPTINTASQNGTYPLVPLGAQPTAVLGAGGVLQSSVTGALPAVFTSTVTNTGILPRMFVKVA